MTIVLRSLWSILLLSGALVFANENREDSRSDSDLHTKMAFSFQKIEAGSFKMGSPLDEPDRNPNENQVNVTISKDFEIMTTEVTQSQWFDVMGYNPSHFKTEDYCGNHVTIKAEKLCPSHPSHPVERVSWTDVQSYIKKLNDMNGVSGCYGTPQDASGCYRLPTEAEWEFAARGGTTSAYSFGDGNIDGHAWYWKNSGDKTHRVGLKKANSYGLYDMSGNVFEWVQDWYASSLPGGTDPLRSLPGSYYRVIRGGSWRNGARKYLRSALRDGGRPGYEYNFVGFRLVRTL